jgi:two-component system, cell cycle sensor histidine kinase and response regulator CckA
VHPSFSNSRPDATGDAVAAHREDLATLAGGVAQEFNTLLSVVLAYGDLLPDLAGNPARLREAVGHMMAAARRGTEVVHQLQLFARTEDCPLEPHDFHELIRDQVARTTSGWPASIEVRMEFADDPARFPLNPSQCALAVHHVLRNAREALRASTGLIVLATQRTEAPEGSLFCLSVSDNGAGMDTVTLERCTAPFFTQSRPPGMTGLGLAVVSGIIRSHGGRLLIESAPHSGTCVHLCFPCAHAPAVSPAACG